MWLNKTNNSDWLPVALEYLKTCNPNLQEKEKFFKKLERLSSYLHITAQDVNKRISRYAKILIEIAKCNSKELSSIELNNEEKQSFFNILSRDIYTDMVAKRRNYLILRLDFALSDKSKTIEYNPDSLTVEHVLPQTTENTEWEQIWPDKDIRLKWVHKLGNLVPLNRRANSAARNWGFKRKKEEYFLSKKTKTSDYALTTQVVSCDIWDEKTVEQRQKDLLEILITEWELKID